MVKKRRLSQSTLEALNLSPSSPPSSPLFPPEPEAPPPNTGNPAPAGAAQVPSVPFVHSAAVTGNGAPAPATNTLASTAVRAQKRSPLPPHAEDTVIVAPIAVPDPPPSAPPASSPVPGPSVASVAQLAQERLPPVSAIAAVKERPVAIAAQPAAPAGAKTMNLQISSSSSDSSPHHPASYAQPLAAARVMMPALSTQASIAPTVARAPSLAAPAQVPNSVAACGQRPALSVQALAPLAADAVAMPATPAQAPSALTSDGAPMAAPPFHAPAAAAERVPMLAPPDQGPAPTAAQIPGPPSTLRTEAVRVSVAPAFIAGAAYPRIPAVPGERGVSPAAFGRSTRCFIESDQRVSIMRGPGRYTSLVYIGSGAHGRVYKAADRLAPRPVALKVFSAAGVASFPVIKRWAHQLLSALDAVHKEGLVHFDVKPANVLLHATGSVMLADFGLAEDGLMRAQDLGPAMDIWAWAVAAMEIMTGPGRVVFMRETPLQMMTLIAESLVDGRYNLGDRELWTGSDSLPGVLHDAEAAYNDPARGKRRFRGGFGLKGFYSQARKSLPAGRGVDAILDCVFEALELDPNKRPTCEGLLKHSGWTAWPSLLIAGLLLMARSKPIAHQRREGLHPSHKKPGIKLVPKQRARPAEAAIRDIRRYQRSTEHLIHKLPFRRLVRELSQDHTPPGTRKWNERMWYEGYMYSEKALEAMQDAAEAYIVELLEDCAAAAAHAKRKTIMPSDMALALRLRGDVPRRSYGTNGRFVGGAS
ncbi:hypothetical protein OC834_006361 [Tilletia horrida]|nr:hypothetical protein OC834_006361 [Tilletia horrida]